MPRFCDLMECDVPTFRGLKYTNGDLEIGIQLLKEGRNVLLGADIILCGALSLGFDSAILTSLNICPEVVNEIYNHSKNGDYRSALETQMKLNGRIKKILSNGTGEWVECMKREFNSLNIPIKAGTTRKPTVSMNRK